MSHLEELNKLAHIAHPDHARADRTGIPEIILTNRKSIAQNLDIAARLLAQEGRAILSRVSAELLHALQEHFPDSLEVTSSGTTVVLRGAAGNVPVSGGRVGILTAGTSDIPIAEEAAVLCREVGCHVQTAYDVGVAGLHRLHQPLHMMLHETAVDVIIVAAGMDGALPSVVAGLVDVPVIGLPTSIGYGMGGEGVAALMSMLQSCAPGLAVVNIDNGIGAGAMAARIANRAAAARGA
jgi:hypothetical protein